MLLAMPLYAPAHVTERARLLLEIHDGNAAVVARALGKSKRTIERWRLCFELFGDAYAPISVAIGRPRRLTMHQEQVSSCWTPHIRDSTDRAHSGYSSTSMTSLPHTLMSSLLSHTTNSTSKCLIPRSTA